MNKATIMGNLARNPSIFRKNDKITARFTVAVNDRQFSKTDYIPCVCFGKGAEIVEAYFVKGKKVLLSGKITSSSYVKDGETKYEVCMLVTEIEFPERKDAGESAHQETRPYQAPEQVSEQTAPPFPGQPSSGINNSPVSNIPPVTPVQNVQYTVPGQGIPAPQAAQPPEDYMPVPDDMGLPFV